MEKIKIENLTFTYPGKSTPALTHINLSVSSGEFVTIIGKSGCGKSTLLRCLKPALTPAGEKEGAIFFEGSSLYSLSQAVQAREIGMITQNPDNQIVCDKVWHELAFGLENLGYNKDEIRTRVAEMSAFFGIEGWFHKDTSQLSGGQKQLLCLASVMAMSPSLLILDEPTAQLDPISAQDFLSTLSRINKELGTTVILTEHRLEDALPLSDRVLVMDTGTIIADAPCHQIGKILKEKSSPMLLALPTPSRVFLALDDQPHCPVTVREGRKWLETKDIANVEIAPKKIPPSSETVMELRDLWFRYEKNQPDILRGLSLKIQKGELYAILGGNGSGKTTTLAAIAGIHKPYRGKIIMPPGKTVALLPQNPQCLFIKDTLALDLAEVLEASPLSPKEKERRISDISKLLQLEDLLDFAPYDLSGGEQQRAALAKVLLSQPDILILDEPTKGLDAHFKTHLARLLKNLQKSGKTILIVSHDVEFCAEYADRLGMFFDGTILSQGTPREFFSGKCFYTTAANRMARGILPDAILAKDITDALGVKETKPVETPSEPMKLPEKEASPAENEQKKKNSPVKIIFGLGFLALFCVLQYYLKKKHINSYSYPAIAQVGSIFIAAAMLMCWIPIKNRNKVPISPMQTPDDKGINLRTFIGAGIILLLIPLTLYIGVVKQEKIHYNLLSMIIIFETLLPFGLIFEGRRPKARELVLISVLCALTVAGRIVFGALPQFKPVIAMVIISGICLGGEVGFLVGAVSAFASNFYFTQGIWTPWQMFCFGIVGMAAGLLFHRRDPGKITVSVFGLLATVIIYGGIMDPASIIMANMPLTKENLLTFYAGGFLPNLIHGISTAFFLWFGYEPLAEKISRIKIKYGLK